jgi:hypothetical protein
MFTNLDAEALNVVQTINESLDIPSMSELGGSDVLLEECLVRVIVRWITIDVAVQEECVDRKAPVGRRRMECVVIPFSRVVQRVFRVLVCVQVPLRILWRITKGCDKL